MKNKTEQPDRSNIKYLEYIKNAGGRPKLSQFIEDWEPIGILKVNELIRFGWAKLDFHNGQIVVTWTLNTVIKPT